MKNSKKGWVLLIVSLAVSLIAMNIGVIYGSSLGGEAGNLYGIICALIGFMIPPIVYFGNKLG